MQATELIIIILLAVMLLILITDRITARQRLKNQSDTLSKAVGERIDGTIKVFGDLREKLGELSLQTRDIQDVGKNICTLQDILQSPKLRGGFGELLLERMLDDMLPTEVWSVQHRFRSGEIVDAVIRVNGCLVPVDSKFPLEDFQRYSSAQTEEEQIQYRRQFARTVKKHIDNVAKYIRPDEKTFDFAMMYIPAENVYYETIVRNTEDSNDIYTYALSKKVIPVSPTSFYAYLQVILQGLRGLRIESEAREILGKLGRLQTEFSSLEHEFEVLGSHLINAVKKYNETTSRLTRFEDKLHNISAVPASRSQNETTKDKE